MFVCVFVRVCVCVYMFVFVCVCVRVCLKTLQSVAIGASLLDERDFTVVGNGATSLMTFQATKT